MDDHPPESQAPKVARERDEDGDDHLPSAKRTKTEELNEPRAESSEGVPYQNGDGPAGPSDAPPMTDYERKEYSKIVKNATRTNSGKNFKDPVTLLWPALAEGYLAKIAHPVDLGLIDRKLKGNSYANLQEFKADFNLIYDNCVTFNSADHEVTRSARVLRDNVFEKIRSIPPPPAPAVKKEKKQKPTPDPAVRAAASRRRSKETAPKPVQPATPAAPTFALDPTTNTPLIRRDSTKNQDGGRPKREIHPPKNKDLPYSAVKPKNKKFATELKFCDDVLGELKKPKHWAMNSVFAEPVDPVALNIPNYFTVIKLPMDLRTIQGKLDEGQYGSAKDFEKDMRLMITNCLKFNPAGNPIHQIGVDFQNLFGSLWANKEKWVAEHSPAVASPSPPPESEEDESEDDEEQDAAIAAGGQSAAAARLIEEQQKLIDLMTAKKKDQAQIAIQQSMIEVLKQAVASSQAVPKRQKKAKAPKAKKAATVKKDKVPVKRAGNKLQSRYMGTIEKEVISAGLSSLPDEIANEVLTLIKQDQQGVDVGDDGTLELDIDVVSNHVLWKIHDLIMTYAPAVDASIREAMQEREVPRAPAKPVSKKKNKPMNKDDQEKNIEILQNRLKDFDRQGSGSQEPVMQSKSQHEVPDFGTGFLTLPSY
ncbi:Bromodomain-containing protein [Amylocarpus encephaloides]|uniref:Bromodomain-containing protein n=1 Tax=Amylocarpus encephaloides TaxID=45428 RepID=A0A9P8C3L2_9HELO|nr:Bromodomain-containing protein [Amylocarpus encephaloides]